MKKQDSVLVIKKGSILRELNITLSNSRADSVVEKIKEASDNLSSWSKNPVYMSSENNSITLYTYKNLNPFVRSALISGANQQKSKEEQDLRIANIRHNATKSLEHNKRANGELNSAISKLEGKLNKALKDKENICSDRVKNSIHISEEKRMQICATLDINIRVFENFLVEKRNMLKVIAQARMDIENTLNQNSV